MAVATNETARAPRWITGVELATMHVEPREQLIQGLLPAEGCTLLAADAKAGKSTLSLELCRAVCTGTPALEALAAQEGGALFWMADDTARDRFVLNYQRTFQNEPLPNFEVFLERLPLYGGGFDLLRTALERTRARLVIIDCLTAVRNARDQADDFVQQEYDELRDLSEIGREFHCCIVVIHHLSSGRRASGPNPFIGMAGSFALTGGADGLVTIGLFSMTRRERIVTAVHRDGLPTRFLYAMDATTGRLFWMGPDEWVSCWDDVMQAYRTMQGSTFDGKELGEALGISDRAGRAKLARWRAAGLIEDVGGKKHSWASTLVDVMRRLLVKLEVGDENAVGKVRGQVAG